MKKFLTDNALRLFVGGLFVVAIGITVLLHNYSNQVQQSMNDDTAPGTVVSDTLQEDYTVNKVSMGN